MDTIASSVRVSAWPVLAAVLIGSGFSQACLAQDAAAASVGNVRKNGPEAIDFFCPELVAYRQQLKTASLTNSRADLEQYLRSVTKQARVVSDGGTNQLGSERVRLARAVLHVIAADAVGGLAAPIMEVLRTIDDPLVQTVAERALAATVAEDEIGRIERVVAAGESERVRACCIRVLGRLRPSQLEPQLVEVLKGPRSDDVELATAIVLAECGHAAALDSLLSLLASTELATRHRAAAILRKWTNQDFGYSAYQKERDRAYAIRRWRQWFSSFDENTLKPLQLRRDANVLAVRGQELLQFGRDGRIVQRRDGFNSLSQAIGISGGHRLVADFMGRAWFEYDEKWREVNRHQAPFQPRGSYRLENGQTLVIGMHRFQLFNSSGAAAGAAIRFPFETNFTGATLIGSKRFLVTCNNTGFIREFDLSGGVLWEMLAENHPRSVQVLDDGRLLVADFQQAVIYSPEGSAEWRHAIEGVRSAHRLPTGNILLGHPSGLSVIDAWGDVLWETKQPPKRGFGFFAQLE